MISSNMLIDEKTFQLLKQVITKKGKVTLPAIGKSMYPLIQQGDLCEFSSIDACSIQKGDIILFYTESSQLVAHRFYQKQQEYLNVFKGDANLGFDQPVNDMRIIGKLVSIFRNETRIELNRSIPVAWGKLVCSPRLLSGILTKLAKRAIRGGSQ